jgi:uncharacterized protein YbjT (DUF2867 family)
MSGIRSSFRISSSWPGPLNQSPGMRQSDCPSARRTSPIDAQDVAEVVATILASPTAHIGKVYELTGPRSQDMHAMAAEYSDALVRTITYVMCHWSNGETRSFAAAICRTMSSSTC